MQMVYNFILSPFFDIFHVFFSHLFFRLFRKIVFFKIHCNPSLACIAVRDLQSFQRNASVQSLLLAGNFVILYLANKLNVAIHLNLY